MSKIEKTEKREKKYAAIPTQKFSSAAPFFYLTTRPCTAKYAWRFIFVILRDFFALQYLQHWHITKRRVINVETETDNKIPFTPSYVDIYIEFFPFFIRQMDMLKKRLGYKKASPYLCLYLKYLTSIYANSASIYRYTLTTTTRPKYLKNSKFRTIHFFDPHLLCVPSIHVAISVGTYAWFKQLFETDILPKEESERRLAEIKKQAKEIVESVLFVKQHSVNCIPTAMYMLTATMGKSFFPIQDAIDFIDTLFVSTPEISKENRDEIINHFYYLYERTLLESKYSDNWQDCIKHWLDDFAFRTNQ